VLWIRIYFLKDPNPDQTSKPESDLDPSSTVFYKDAPDTVFAGSRISGKGRIPDIRPDTWFDNYIFDQISNKFKKQFNNYRLLQTLNKAYR
jgi:hypothetical protein